jgi:hypothetical protein
MNNLVFANIPHDCKEDELQDWLERKGFTVVTLHLVRDAVTSTSPAFARVQVQGDGHTEAVEVLHRQELRGYRVLVRAVI